MRHGDAVVHADQRKTVSDSVSVQADTNIGGSAVLLDPFGARVEQVHAIDRVQLGRGDTDAE